MNILIINCHTANRGDEAAVHALVDELIELYPEVQITLGMRGPTQYPNLPNNVKSIKQLVIDKSDLKYAAAKMSRGKVALGRTYTQFISSIRKADVVLHAPGGPSIGDTYYEAEASYLRIYDLLIAMKKPYMFYAPSMGPFNKQERNGWRKKVLNNAKAIALRDPISAEYVKGLLPNKKIYQTLDSAFQHDIEMNENKMKFYGFTELKKFVEKHKRCVGVTITDLTWHPVYSKDNTIAKLVRETFESSLDTLTEKGYGIVFIPQLYGTGDDYQLMKSFCKNASDYFVVPANDSRYDTYFQQYLIGKLYAVIGMRYHSNIFSAKMGTPFVSISYEQKMQGFMEKLNLSDYCIKLKELSSDMLLHKFSYMQENYTNYKNYLLEEHINMKQEAYKTTKIVEKVINSLRG